MDFIWNEFIKERRTYSQLGQSTVEYLLLFTVIISIAYTIFNSSKFNEFFGKNGTIAKSYKNQVEFSYRHGLAGSEPLGNINYKDGGSHKTYKGRFFSAKDAYPK